MEAQIKSSASTSSRRCCDFTRIFTGCAEPCFELPSWLTSCSSRSVGLVCASIPLGELLAGGFLVVHDDGVDGHGEMLADKGVTRENPTKHGPGKWIEQALCLW